MSPFPGVNRVFSTGCDVISGAPDVTERNRRGKIRSRLNGQKNRDVDKLTIHFMFREATPDWRCRCGVKNKYRTSLAIRSRKNTHTRCGRGACRAGRGLRNRAYRRLRRGAGRNHVCDFLGPELDGKRSRGASDGSMSGNQGLWTLCRGPDQACADWRQDPGRSNGSPNSPRRSRTSSALTRRTRGWRRLRQRVFRTLWSN